MHPGAGIPKRVGEDVMTNLKRLLLVLCSCGGPGARPGPASEHSQNSAANDRQLMDLTFTVGQYTMLSMFLNSAGVQQEEAIAGLPK